MSVSAKDRYQDIKDFCEDLYGGYEETSVPENKESEVESETSSEIKVTEIAEQQKSQYILHNPKVEDDSSTESGKKVTWNCLWFGSYPQSQITAEDGEIYTILTNIDNWNKNGDVIIENTKYHKTEKDYFKYEPIKWRVLQSENGEAFLLSDVILDKQLYNENDKYVTWEKSSLRAWLNNKFIKRAFIDEEREKMTQLLNHGFIDTYRYLYPLQEGVYSWWSYRFKAREKNAGWRIDYFIVSDSLKDKIIDATIETEIMGSDHCPVTLTIDL